LNAPEPTEGWTIVGVAAVGIVINTATALLFMRGRERDLNIRGAFIHMAADALVSAGVVLGGALYLWQGWAWIDPVMSLSIAVVIVVGTASLFKQALHLLFDGVPEGVNLEQVRTLLLGLPGVVGIHDLHVWAMGSSQVALTAHLVVSLETLNNSGLLAQAQHELHERFEIRHVTLQTEKVAYSVQCPGLSSCSTITSGQGNRKLATVNDSSQKVGDIRT
jgi:cobalt-zinc-cadmium efflux system protein